MKLGRFARPHSVKHLKSWPNGVSWHHLEKLLSFWKNSELPNTGGFTAQELRRSLQISRGPQLIKHSADLVFLQLKL